MLLLLFYIFVSFFLYFFCLFICVTVCIMYVFHYVLCCVMVTLTWIPQIYHVKWRHERQRSLCLRVGSSNPPREQSCHQLFCTLKARQRERSRLKRLLKTFIVKCWQSRLKKALLVRHQLMKRGWQRIRIVLTSKIVPVKVCNDYGCS